MRKLSEFTGQEHITAPLRAMVLTGNVTQRITIYGDEALAHEIVLAFVGALNCLNNQRGDLCGKCSVCTTPTPWSQSFSRWSYLYTEGSIYEALPRRIYYSFNQHVPGFLEFTLKEAIGRQLNSNVVRLFAQSLVGQKSAALKTAQGLAELLTLPEFLDEYLELLKTLLYLQNNLEVVEIENLDLLRKAAVRISTSTVVACIRALWDAQAKSVISDALGIQIVSALLSETLCPSPESETTETPIYSVEEANEQRLSIEEMLEVARE